MTSRFDPIPIFNQELQRLNCGGALLAVSENGQITTCSAGTLAGTDHDRPFYIYSISKTLTAAALLRLSEEGKLRLDAPLTTYLTTHPSIPEVTARQVLNHTSGLSDYFSAPDYQKAVSASPSHPWSAKKLMEVGLRNTPLFEAGTGWSYSNPGYALLKQLIESLSEKSYHTYILDDLLKDLPLKHTRAFLTIDHRIEMLPGEAPGMTGDFRSQYHPGWIAPGCFISTVAELTLIFDALFDERLITRRSLDEMTETVAVLPSCPDGPSPSYGLGIMHERNSPLGDAFGHGGGGPGYTTYALHYPALAGNKVSIAMVLNKSLPETPFRLTNQLVRHYLDTR